MISLTDLTDADEEVLFLWRQEPEVGRWMSDVEIDEREAHRRWFKRLRADPDLRGWMIRLDEAPAGLLTLADLASHHRRGAWNWFVGDAKARGRGVSRAAQVLGLDKAF